MRGADPITLMKSVKNATEIAATAPPMCAMALQWANFLAWFDPRGAERQADRNRGAGNLRPNRILISRTSGRTARSVHYA